ncbi:MAG: transposase [Patescibacteria group bacterium]|nr:transposase [Patescibacteria group bacterium]
MIDIFEYDFVVAKMREFFKARGFIEVPVQSRVSILAACEDPKTVAKYDFGGTMWPLPQTGQVWLEIELLKHPEVAGVFCISTSYRDEPNPIPGRHDKIFPMVEFESRGDMVDLMKLESELLGFLGFSSPAMDVAYNNVAKFYAVEDLQASHETDMQKDFAPIVFLTHFPFTSHPFWNMKHIDNDIFAKVDVIIHGMETIGSAERSCSPEEMRKYFYTVSEGGYAQLLFDLFGRERVERELEAYLALPMTKRFGGGIGVTRMIRAMKLEGVMPKFAQKVGVA